MAFRHRLPTPSARGILMLATVAGGIGIAAGPAAAAELTASAVSTPYGYTLAYNGTNFPRGVHVQIVLAGAGPAISLGAATAGLDGGFRGIATLRCSPLGGGMRQNATLSAVLSPNGPRLAAANIGIACVLQH